MNDSALTGSEQGGDAGGAVPSDQRLHQMLSQAAAGTGREGMHVEWGAPGEGAKRLFIAREIVIQAMRAAAVFATDQVVWPDSELGEMWELLTSLTWGRASAPEQLAAALFIRKVIAARPTTDASQAPGGAE